jgi:hypothetical protein
MQPLLPFDSPFAPWSRFPCRQSPINMGALRLRQVEGILMEVHDPSLGPV